ncbi:putative mitochondrial-processing peptidase subunit beta mitochondrial [Zea mays]|uniref:Putative mitochondrial-processing peptidase subunit beta mitochondrial n=1 Tax=Zea mays TaxID=4577 RepID=A0A1D6F9C0_MAIZE|nr:putative mitochondrial-processing peptidase subunit beta mitochondrial [Zea mays]
MPLAQFVVAFNGASWVDPDSVALMVMQSMLGSWNKSAGGGKHMGSELVQKAAINDIAASVMSFNMNYKDTGLFGVYAVAKANCLDDLAFAIMHEMSKLSYRVTEEDVIRARNQLLTYGRRIPTPELFARIDVVDASTVKRVANRFIFDQDVAIVAMGPIQGLPDYNWFRRRTYMLRY